MQKISYVINAVLLVLIGVLFFLVLNKKSSGTDIKLQEGAKVDKSVKIAYVDVDSIQDKYKYFTEKRDELKKKAESMEGTLQSKKMEFQKMYETAQNNAPTMTDNEMEATQIKLQNKQMELQNFEANFSDQLDRETADFNEAFLKRLEDYIQKINADKKYTFVLTYSRNSASLLYTDKTYDITNAVIQGLNKEYEESIKK